MPKVFQFRVDFTPRANPKGRHYRFERRMIKEILAGGLDCFMGALGGMWLSYGVVMPKRRRVTLGQRDRIVAWINRQRISATVAIGDLEELDTSDIMREVTERTFKVDNLTIADRRAARAHWGGARR